MPAADRYSRHRAIPGFSQARLQASRFIVVGAGAIGNEVVKNLCLLGVGRIDLYDFDTVELHNLTRSVLLREADVGAPKALAVAARARELDPAVRLRAIAGDLHDTMGPLALSGCTTVIGALDNFEARLRVNLLCWLTRTDWVNAAIDSRHASVESFPFRSSAERSGLAASAPACYECGLPPSVYQRLAERRSCGGLARAAREQRIMPTTAITASVAAAIAVQQALSMPQDSRRWLLDTETGLASTARIGSNAADGGCPACSRAPAAKISELAAAGPLEAGARTCKRSATGAEVARTAQMAGEDLVELAEPIIWSAECANCGSTEATRAIVGRPARRVDDTATFCFGCGEESVRIETRELVDAASLARQFGDRELGLAFVRVGPHLIDATPMSTTMSTPMSGDSTSTTNLSHGDPSP